MKVYKRENEYVVFDKVDYCGNVVEKGTEKYTEIEVYLLDHPEALVDEPKPADLTAEELKQRAINEARAYLSLTDWYVTRFTETGKAVPEDVTIKRAEMRLRI